MLLLILGGVFLHGLQRGRGRRHTPGAVFLVLNAVIIGVGLVDDRSPPRASCVVDRSADAGGGGFGEVPGPALLAFPLLVLGLPGSKPGSA